LDRDPTYTRALPSERWMQFLKHRDIPPDVQAHFREGAAAAGQHRIFVAVEPERRNATWLIDHFQLTIQVVPERGRHAVYPWVTFVFEAFSRRVLGAAVSLRPSQAHVLAALRMAIDTAGTPRQLVFDRGSEFAADAIADTATSLVFAAVPTR